MKKLTLRERIYWSQIFVAVSQITFGLLWVSIFAPIDRFKLILILLNAGLTLIFWIVGWWLVRYK